jgi:hypothetical protein
MGFMHTMLQGALAALLGLTTLVGPAAGKRIAIPPLPDRIAKAQAIIIGKVTSVENKPVKTASGEFAVAVLKVENGLVGVKGLTHIKIAFQPGQLEPGQEACWMLTKMPGENYFMAPDYFSTIRKDDPTYAAQVELVKRSAVILEDPVKGLKGKDANDRLLAAAVMLGKYRPWATASQKQEDIDAVQSKLILEALAEVDWNKFDPNLHVNAQQLFYRLGVTEKDGWVPPMNFQQFAPMAKERLKANAEKYRIKRFVFAEEKK